MILERGSPRRLWRSRQADLFPKDRFPMVNSLTPPAGLGLEPPTTLPISLPDISHRRSLAGRHPDTGYSCRTAGQDPLALLPLPLLWLVASSGLAATSRVASVH